MEDQETQTQAHPWQPPQALLYNLAKELIQALPHCLPKLLEELHG